LLRRLRGPPDLALALTPGARDALSGYASRAVKLRNTPVCADPNHLFS